MAAGNYAKCLTSTLEFEGGWSNHPADPGGATMRGVIQTVYNDYRDSKGRARQTVRNISEAELQEIYKTRYWDKVYGDALPAGVDLATFDFGVNSGPARANQYRNRLGADTAVNIAKRLCQARLAFVRALRTFSVFGKGWTRRIVTIEARSVKMALEAERLPPAEVRRELEKEATAANRRSKQQGGGAVGSGGGTYALSAADWTGIVVIAVGVAVVGILIYRSYINRQRAKAYAEVAEGPQS